MGLEGANFFGYSLAHYYVFGEHRPGRTDVWQEFVERRDREGYSPEAALAAEQETLGAKAAAGDVEGLRGAIGTPDQLRAFLRRYEQAGVDEVIFVLQAGRTRHDDVLASLERFGTEVLPEFAERDEAATAAKAARLAPAVEAALARRPDDGPAVPDGYAMRAYPRQMVDAADSDEGRRFLDRVAGEESVGDHSTMEDLTRGSR